MRRALSDAAAVGVIALLSLAQYLLIGVLGLLVITSKE